MKIDNKLDSKKLYIDRVSHGVQVAQEHVSWGENQIEWFLVTWDQEDVVKFDLDVDVVNQMLEILAHITKEYSEEKVVISRNEYEYLLAVKRKK